MSRLWLPDTEELRERALEQYELQLQTDVERLWRRQMSAANEGVPSGNPDINSVLIPPVPGNCYGVDMSHPMTVTTAGIVANNCQSCPHLNRTWLLQGAPAFAVGSTCLWFEVIGVTNGYSCTTFLVTHARMRLVIGSGNDGGSIMIYLEQSAGVYSQLYAIYQIPSLPHGGPYIFNLTSANSLCDGWPLVLQAFSAV